jgi:hypothetical protein
MIADSYYSLYSYDNASQGYVDSLHSSSHTSNRARQKSISEEGMSWTYPPAFPPRGNSVSGHGAYQSEEPHHQVFPVSTAGYGVPTASYADTYTADGYTEDGYAPVDETQYHSVFQAEPSVQQSPMGPAEITSRVPFDAVDIYADLAIDPSLDAANAMCDVPQSTFIEGIQSDLHTDEPAVKEPSDDVPTIGSEESEKVEDVVEELVQIPTIEVGFISPALCNLGGLLYLQIDATEVDPLALETTTFGTSALASMLTPELRPFMELPSSTSPTVDLFPTHEKSQDHQISEVDLVDSEQLLTPDGVIQPLQKLGSLKQAVSTLPLVKCPAEASPITEPIFGNNQVLVETLRTEFDTPEQTLTVSVTDPAAQDATAPLSISAIPEGPLESELSIFNFDEESQLPSTLEESQAFGHTNESVMHVSGSCLKLITSAGNSNAIAFAVPLSSPVNLIWIPSSKMQTYRHSDGNQSKKLPVAKALVGNCGDYRMVLAPLLLMGRD